LKNIREFNGSSPSIRNDVGSGGGGGGDMYASMKCCG